MIVLVSDYCLSFSHRDTTTTVAHMCIIFNNKDFILILSYENI